MKAMFCSNCGNKLEDNANFCPQCGTKVAGNDAPSTSSAPVGTLAEPNDTVSTFTDPRDGRVYKTVKIGNQVWMAENLAFDAPGSRSYGDDGFVVGADGWDKIVLPEEMRAYCKKYGRLYDWETAMKVCPPGWHLPSKEEWQTLIDFVGGKEIAGKKLRAKSGWADAKGKSCNGTDDFGFAALPGGGFSSLSDGMFSGAGFSCGMWSSSENYSNGEGGWMNYIWPIGLGESTEFSTGPDGCFSVRCIKNDANYVAKTAPTKTAKAKNNTEDDPNDLSWLDEPVPQKTANTKLSKEKLQGLSDMISSAAGEPKPAPSKAAAEDAAFYRRLAQNAQKQQSQYPKTTDEPLKGNFLLNEEKKVPKERWTVSEICWTIAAVIVMLLYLRYCRG